MSVGADRERMFAGLQATGLASRSRSFVIDSLQVTLRQGESWGAARAAEV